MAQEAQTSSESGAFCFVVFVKLWLLQTYRDEY
jgi:hypothetical protein